MGFHFGMCCGSAVASTMLELPGARGSDGDVPPSHDVEWECWFAGLAR